MSLCSNETSNWVRVMAWTRPTRFYLSHCPKARVFYCFDGESSSCHWPFLNTDTVDLRVYHQTQPCQHTGHALNDMYLYKEYMY